MLAVVDYKAGNLTSVKLAFHAVGCDAVVTSDVAVIRRADRVVFPGVGAAGSAMRALDAMGLSAVLRETAASGKPFLGICLGTQILFERSEEDGGVDMLGILPGTVPRFRPTDARDKVPQIGWNQVTYARQHPIFEGIADASDFYFVHGFYPAPADDALTVGRTTYAGVTFASAVGRGAVVATQFHPEKSGRIGLRLLDNFLKWNP